MTAIKRPPPLQFRIGRVRRLLELAARLEGKSVTEFARDAAVERARAVIDRETDGQVRAV